MPNVHNTAEPSMTKMQLEFHQSIDSVYSDVDAAEKSHAAKIANGNEPRYEELTPAIAAALVRDHNRKNRDVSISKVYGYRDAMNRGEWKINHQGLAFYSDSTIADGQHRMFALALSDVSALTFLVSPNFDDKAIDTIDVGKNRNAGDALAMLGIADAKLKGTISKSAMNILHLIEQGTGMKNITVQQIEKFVEKFDDKLDWAIRLGRSSTKQVSEPCMSERESAEVSFLLRVGGYPEGYVAGFIAALQQGMAPYPNAPHTDLTRKLVKSRLSDRSKDKLTATKKYALLLKGAYIAATEQGVSKVAWDPSKESFPTNKPPTAASFEDMDEAA
jgi:hypothetical protein